ncbi:MAG: hypothetical protein ACJAVI_002194 [Candidatus Azotimanducaceae bacterium]|jgi:hypothetical protein
MHEKNSPASNLQNLNLKISNRQLIIRGGIALLTASLLLIVIILPAEYNLDPTGIGSSLGIKGLSIVAPTEPISLTASPNLSTKTSSLEIHNEITPPLKFIDIDLTLEPYGQVEFKLKMLEKSTVAYTWQSAEGEVYADLHGHTIVANGSEEEEIVVRYMETQQGNGESGNFIAPFGGDHGWYFLSLETHPIIVNVRISGHFESHKIIDIGPQM